jgi:DNA integrity scanning protein DisA with diadenylate cyclase activity
MAMVLFVLQAVSRCLAKAFAKNSKPKGFHETIPSTLHSHEDVFSETAFDTLPECQKQDHAIKLECEPLPGFRKVYPMTLMEQTKMDAFLKEALATGCTRQSKSPLGALVCLSRRRMVHSALARTTKHSMPSCEKIDTLSYSLKT